MEQITEKTDNKTTRLVVRCTSDEHDRVFAIAELHRMSVSKYVLSKALDNEIKSVDEHELINALIKLKADLNRLGNLFKLQIDKSQDYTKTLQQIREVIDELGRVLEDKLK